MMRFRSPIVSALTLAAADAYAAASPAAASATASEVGGNVFQLMLMLAVTLAALIGGLWLLKKMMAQRGEAAGLLRLVAGTAVGPRERVVIVEAGGSWLVLGVAPGRVSALAEIPRQSIVAAPKAPTAKTPSFSDWLGKLKQKSQNGDAS